MDEEFERKRAKRAQQAQGSAGDSMAAAGESLSDGFIDGFSGILLKPMEGSSTISKQHNTIASSVPMRLC